MLNAKIYERFLDYCEPLAAPSGWRLAENLDCGMRPASLTNVLARLVEEFLEHELIESGLAKQLPDGLVVNTLLYEATAVVALRASAEAPPYGLLTAAGVITAEVVPVIAALSDYKLCSFFGTAPPVLFVAFSWEDLLVLRGLGLPATFANALLPGDAGSLEMLSSACRWGTSGINLSGSNPNPDQAPTNLADSARVEPVNVVSHTSSCVTTPTESASAQPDAIVPSSESSISRGTELFEASSVALAAVQENTITSSLNVTPLPREGDHSGQGGEAVIEQAVSAPTDGSNPTTEEPIEIVLVGWSLATLDLACPFGLAAIVRTLLDAERYLNADVSGIAVWRPAREDVDRMRFCRTAGSLSSAAQAVRDSASESIFMLDAVVDDAWNVPGAQLGYLPSLRQLEEHLANDPASANSRELRTARRAFEDAIERDLIAPLQQLALTTESPTKRSLGIMSADLARILHRHAPLVGSRRSLTTLSGVNEAAEINLNSVLKISSELRSIFRELGQ